MSILIFLFDSLCKGELKNEKRILNAHPSDVIRKGARLTLHLKNGKTVVLKDDQESTGGPYSSHRVIAVSPDEWVALFEPSSDSMTYRIVHLANGAEETLDGCPQWSSNRNYFASVNEDWESGQTKNDASLWYCETPSVGCTKIWNLPKAGGREAHWKEGEVKITVTESAEAKPRTITCTPKGATANCQ